MNWLDPNKSRRCVLKFKGETFYRWGKRIKHGQLYTVQIDHIDEVGKIWIKIEGSTDGEHSFKVTRSYASLKNLLGEWE
jgi:hypothetical protein